MARKEFVLDVNGYRYEVKTRITATLAEVLREELGFTGVKLFCNEGECGACTVLINGTPLLSCMMLAMDAAGGAIQTIEGMSDPATGDLHPIQQAFVDMSGMQCAVCTPGMILTAKALIEENPNPTEDEICEAMSGNLCRCGNYLRITECILAAAEVMRKGNGND